MGYKVPRKRFLFIFTSGGRSMIILILSVLCAGMIINIGAFAVFINKSPLDGINIIIDPGHGGVDGGTGQEYGVLEKDINLDIAFVLKQELLNRKSFVTMTRDRDVSLEKPGAIGSRHVRDLNARVEMFNSGKHDYFISIHVNSSPKKSSLGPLILYSKKIPESVVLAKCIQKSLNKHVIKYSDEDAVHRPVSSDFFILESSNIPGVILETGFITNDLEKELLQKKDYQAALAKAVADGIENYLLEIRKIRRLNRNSKYEKGVDIPINTLDSFKAVINSN